MCTKETTHRLFANLPSKNRLWIEQYIQDHKNDISLTSSIITQNSNGKDLMKVLAQTSGILDYKSELVNEKILHLLKNSLGQYGRPYIWELFTKDIDVRQIYIIYGNNRSV